MAIVRTGGIVQSVSGQLGPNIFARHGGGTTLGRRPPPKPPYRYAMGAPYSAAYPANPDPRACFANAVRAWADLSSYARAQWRQIATYQYTTDRLGRTRQMSGRELYVQHNFYKLIARQGTTTSPPSVARSPGRSLTGVALRITGTTPYMLLQYTPSPSQSSSYGVAFARLQWWPRAVAPPIWYPWRLLPASLTALADTAHFFRTDDYFGPMLAGSVGRYTVRWLDDDRLIGAPSTAAIAVTS